MSTHNICFHGEIRKYQYFWIEKSILSRAMALFLRYIFYPTILEKCIYCTIFTLSIRPDSFRSESVLFATHLEVVRHINKK